MFENFMAALDAFHLIRPQWLLCLPVILMAWWKIRQRDKNHESAQAGIASHLAEAMTLKQTGEDRWKPIDTTALALALLVFAACGPSWSRAHNPFQSETAPMVVVLEVTPSMEETDLRPSRLGRAKFKVLDLIERRAGARTAVIVYAGTAHRLAPLTADADILRSMLDAVSLEVMPIGGANVIAALELAQAELIASATPGSILLVTDGVQSADLQALDTAKDEAPVAVFFAAPDRTPLGALQRASQVVRLTADDSDLDQIQSLAKSAYQANILGDERLEWEDRGWIFAWAGALLIALWFRKGWTVRWAVVACLMTLSFGHPTTARADVADWFLTPDQQGMLSYDAQNFDTAAAQFDDPMWQAQSLMRMGKFEEAAGIFARLDTAEAAFAEGYCWHKEERFHQSARAFERAVALRPDYPEAEQNLLLARRMVTLLTPAQERDTKGDQSGGGQGNPEDIGDTELTSSKETSGNAQAEFTTTEEWMRAVDTDMTELLQIRFKSEAQEAKQ